MLPYDSCTKEYELFQLSRGQTSDNQGYLRYGELSGAGFKSCESSKSNPMGGFTVQPQEVGMWSKAVLWRCELRSFDAILDVVIHHEVRLDRMLLEDISICFS